MQKRSSLLIIVALLLLFSTTAQAGLTISESEIELGPMQEKRMCHALVWTGVSGTTTHTIEYSPNVSRFVTSIKPDNFQLESVSEQCPDDPEARRSCIKDLCRQGNDQYCLTICTTFKGPVEFEFTPEQREIGGAIQDRVSYRATTLTNALTFRVKYTPYPLELLIGLILAVVGLVAGVYWWKFR
jgi:hypothetical protein